ncbi:hypothetical protein CS0771_56260 [Catellatospora sp. IY07-71]|uniref:hypothetical protein n=1 Tax=Catellatospora sp. IY07-71 TaxID=2728827 RepID=UPI001BB32102|nr:hypothetical protein [Catellatospora sp. IY07-71]BCJ76082.1 hypothetical protein CS0771_56260 [Catellatospora sp. IY07-71]
MKLTNALNFVGSTVTVPSISDTALVGKVSSTKGYARPLKEVRALDGPITVRIVDVLHRLAAATAPQVDQTLYEVYKHWGLFRYLGLFETTKSRKVHPPSIKLSQAGRRIRGNQLRVTSEDIGIGFSIMLAEKWLRANGHAGPPRVIDIDVALANGSVRGQKVSKTGSKRPDYLLISDVPGRLGAFTLAVLECKGTTSRSVAYGQLARGGGQLDGVTIAAEIPDGLVTSTVMGTQSIKCLALQTSRPRFTDRSATTSLPPAPATPAIQLDLTRLDDRFADDSRANDSNETLVEGALMASWASLGELSGNRVAFQRWSHPSRAYRFTSDDRDGQHGSYVTGGNRHVMGQRKIVPLPGGLLEVTLGVDAEVDEALRAGSPSDVLLAQQSAGRRALENVAIGAEPDAAAAYGADGSVLHLRRVG